MLDNIIKKLNENPDFVVRKININNCDVTFLFFETLTSTSNINDFILKYTSYLKANKKLILNIDKYLSTYVPNFKIKKLDLEDDILTNLFSGFVIMCISNNFYSMEVRRQLDSGIEKASNEKVIKGPKDAFCENYQTNIGLIRKRIRTDALVLKELNVGQISKTKVGIMYDKDICDIKCVEKIITKIKSIDIDTIIDSNYIYEYIKEDKTLFPSVITTERPDLVSYKILNGKVAIVVENTPYVLLLPAFFIEFFHTMDDYYQNTKNTVHMRIIRLISFIIAVILPALYIALITYNHEIIPPSLLINFTMQKEGVPFPTILEALIMNVIFEILRETDLRTPSTLGSALSIVGAIVLGDAAVEAGLVSPIMVIVIAITAISELIFSNNEMSNVVKLWRLLFIIFAGLYGMVGVFVCVVLMTSSLSSVTSIGYPYLYPYAPYNKNDLNNAIRLTEKYKLTLRNKLTSFKNKIRGRI